MPSGRPARVPHQGAVLGLLWSDLDDVKLVLGLASAYDKTVLLRGARYALLDETFAPFHTEAFRYV